MNLGKDKLNQIQKICEDAPDICLSSFEVEAERMLNDESYLKMKTDDKKSPRILRICDCDTHGIVKVIPYYLIKERPEAQITSYAVGKELCNLAEVKELFGSLYSRYCGSYNQYDLPHQDSIQSRIGLWIHDCLTQDLDHDHVLNRYHLMDGEVISYDYGMSFLRNYFPPFYTFELGIRDCAIIDNKTFLIKLLTRYALRTKMEEDTFINDIIRSYPKTIGEDICRYYFRNFKTYFVKRVYSGRFLDKLKSTSFVRGDVSDLGEAMNLNMKKINNWEQFIKNLSEIRFQQMDLQGLDLSGADLRKADLKNANLRNANFEGANLESADLRGADVTGANMENANVKGALTD